MTFDPIRFLDRGYDFVDLHISSFPVNQIMEGWQRFLARPLEEKLRWGIQPKGYWMPDPGFFVKDGTRDDETWKLSDEKQYFHFNSRFRIGVNNRLVQPVSLAELAEWNDWLQAQELVYESVNRRFLELARALDGVLGGSVLTSRSNSASVLRTMQYDAGKPGKPHADKSAVTFHLYTSHPGYLMRGESIESPPGKVLVFGGRKLAFVLDRPDLAVQHEAAPYINASGETRKVIVFFGHLRMPELKSPDQANYE